MNTASWRSVSQALGLAALEPSHLPPSAVLLVRRLRDPLPRRLLATPDAMMPSAEWESAVRDALTRCARDAAQPANGAVPSSANAVLFADEGELLACLAHDLLTGDAARRWWWTALRRSLPAGALDALVAAWCRHARAVPAALEVLVRNGTAQTLLNALTVSQTLAVVRELAAAFEMPTLLALVAQDDHAQPARAPHAGPSASGTSPASQPRVDQRPNAPWSPLIQAALLQPILGAERQLLIGVGLTLSRAPTVARSRRFLEQLTTWWQGVQRGAANEPAAHAVLDPTAAETGSTPPSARAAAFATSEPPPYRGPTARESRLPEFDLESPALPPISRSEAEDAMAQREQPSPKPSGGRAPPRAAAFAVTPSDDAAAAVPGLHLDVQRQPPTSRQHATTSHHTPDVGTDVHERARAAPELERGSDPAWVATQIGGTFYLVTLLTRLDFFDVVERHFGLSAPFGGWGWIDLLARILLGERLASHRNDPVWQCLAVLDGRDPRMEVGRSFEGTATYVLPVEWAPHLFTRAEIARARWLSRARVQLWHPEGVALEDRLDIPLGPTHADADRRLRQRFARQAHRRRHLGPAFVRLAPDLRRFLEFLLPFFRWRLTRAMNLDGDAAISEMLLESEARVFVSATHVDVRFPPEEARPTVRLAGLDANPGWVPALGRVVGFEFL